MPHWDKDGNETVICQLCARIVRGDDVEWMKPVPGTRSPARPAGFDGNVCSRCRHAAGVVLAALGVPLDKRGVKP